MSRMHEYTGYSDAVDASVSNEFANAAFRFGHTLVPAQLERLDANYERRVIIVHNM